MSEHEPINPDEWRVRGQLRVNGVIHGPGDPLPALTVAEARRYEAQGSLVHLSPDSPTRQQAVGLLRMRDDMVLRMIVTDRPSLEVLGEMLALVREHGRSSMVRSALEAILFYAARPGASKVEPRSRRRRQRA